MQNVTDIDISLLIEISKMNNLTEAHEWLLAPRTLYPTRLWTIGHLMSTMLIGHNVQFQSMLGRGQLY